MQANMIQSIITGFEALGRRVQAVPFPINMLATVSFATFL
jgi:hypothetical protein